MLLSKHGISYSTVRHEDFATNQQSVFSQFSDILDQPTKHFQELRNSTKDKSKTSDHYKTYYGERLWMKEIDKNSLDRINTEIDWSQLSSYGYDPI